jgi:hypothetical protein
MEEEIEEGETDEFRDDSHLLGGTTAAKAPSRAKATGHKLWSSLKAGRKVSTSSSSAQVVGSTTTTSDDKSAGAATTVDVRPLRKQKQKAWSLKLVPVDIPSFSAMA